MKATGRTFFRYSLALFFLFLFHGCSGPLFDARQTQGTITYKLSFPYNEGELLVELFPQQMAVEFWNSKTRSVLKSLGDVVRSEVLTDNTKHKFRQFLKSYENKFVLSLDEEGVEQMLETMPKFRIENTSEFDTIAGYRCNKSVAYFLNDSVPPITLYHTKEILIEDPNWWNQFNEIQEVLLGYEIEQYGMRMKLIATDVNFKEIDKSLFNSPAPGQSVTFDEMSQQLQRLMLQFK